MRYPGSSCWIPFPAPVGHPLPFSSKSLLGKTREILAHPAGSVGQTGQSHRSRRHHPCLESRSCWCECSELSLLQPTASLGRASCRASRHPGSGRGNLRQPPRELDAARTKGPKPRRAMIRARRHDGRRKALVRTPSVLGQRRGTFTTVSSGHTPQPTIWLLCKHAHAGALLSRPLVGDPREGSRDGRPGPTRWAAPTHMAVLRSWTHEVRCSACSPETGRRYHSGIATRLSRKWVWGRRVLAPVGRACEWRDSIACPSQCRPRSIRRCSYPVLEKSRAPSSVWELPWKGTRTPCGGPAN